MHKIIYADRFIDDLAQVYPGAVLAEIDTWLELLETFPEIGSSNVRESLKRRFGKNLRKIPVSSFVIIYRYDDEAALLEVLAMPYAATIT